MCYQSTGFGRLHSRMTSRPEPTEEGFWDLFVDGSSLKAGCGAGLLIIDPQKNRTEYAIKFDFAASNNEAEYEALLLGIQLYKIAGARRLKAHCDSQVIVGQVMGEFKAKEDSMKMYLRKVKEVIADLDPFTITQIPRSENQQADALSRLASSAEDLSPRPIMWEPSSLRCMPTFLTKMHANLPHQAISSLTTIQAPLPLDMWGMDLLGPFPPALG